MSKCVLILGDSGTGKTASCRNLDPVTSLIIQPEPKDLPFRPVGWDMFSSENLAGSIYHSCDYATIQRVMMGGVGAGKKTIIIDDANYLMMFEEFSRISEVGYSKFSAMALNFLSLIQFCKTLPSDVTVFIMAHTQTAENGRVSLKTTGKMLSEKVVIEGLITIVLFCVAQDGRHYFQTKTDGNKPTKTPIGMFSDDEIDNDLLAVQNTINEYYGVTQ